MNILVTRTDDEGKFISVTKKATAVADTVILNCKCAHLEYYVSLCERLAKGEEKYHVDDVVRLKYNHDQKDRIHRHFLDVLVDDEVVVRLALCPYSSAIQQDLIQMKVYNNWCYRDWVPAIATILKSMSMEVCSFSEIHIALDSTGIVDDMTKLFYSPNVKIKQSRLGGNLDSGLRVNSKNGFHINSRESDVYITCYDKDAEYSTKSYIHDFHKINGLEDGVQRIELRMRKNSVIEKFDLSWWEIVRVDILTAILKHELSKRTRFRNLAKYWYENGNRKYEERNLIEFHSANDLTVAKSNKPESDSLHVDKMLIRRLHRKAIQMESEHCVKALAEIIAERKLESYYNKQYRFWSTGLTETGDAVSLKVKRILNPVLDDVMGRRVDNTVRNDWSVWLSTALNKVISRMVVVELNTWEMECLPRMTTITS